MSTLRDLGVKRKDMESGPCCVPCAPCDSNDVAKKDAWDNEVIHPCVDVYGRAAKMLPLQEMKPGVVYRAEVLIRLKRVSLDEKSGVESGSLAIVAIGDLEPEGGERESDEPVVKVMKAKTSAGPAS